jgi:hypothetical protein
MREVEILARLRQQELVREALHEQALRPETRLSRGGKRGLWMTVGVIVLVALLAAWL